MSKIDDSSISISYDLCQQFYSYEQHLKSIVKKQIHMSYLIDTNSIDNLKKQINYDEMKKYFEGSISFEDFKEKIKNKIKKIKTNLIPEKFKTSKDLIQALNNNKKFYFITNYSLTQKICDNNNLSNKSIKFLLDKEKIIISFNENDELLIYNNSTGIIEKSLLVNNNSNDIEINSQNLGNDDKEQAVVRFVFGRLYSNGALGGDSFRPDFSKVKEGAALKRSKLGDSGAVKGRRVARFFCLRAVGRFRPCVCVGVSRFFLAGRSSFCVFFLRNDCNDAFWR